MQTVDSVAIVIPAYNSMRFIDETIVSALSQSYKLCRTIVVDDCSTDGTYEYILEKYGELAEIRRNSENFGLSKSINNVIFSLDTEYTLLLGHDDILDINHVSELIKNFENDIGMVICNAVKIDSNGRSLGLSREDNKMIKKLTSINVELSVNNFISSCGAIFRTNLFKSVKGWDESFKLYGEWLIFIKFSSQMKIKYSLDSRAFYRQHEGNITKTISKLSSLAEYKKFCREYAVKAFKLNLKQKALVRISLYFIALKDILRLIKYKLWG